MKKIDDTMTNKEWYNIYWNYFELMSRQRINMVNFYISIEIVLFGGFFALLRLETRLVWAEYMVAVAIAFMSVLFYGLDYRTKTMIHKCESLMSQMEDKYKPFKFGASPIQCINNECGGFSYSYWFTVTFIIIGMIGTLFCLMIYSGRI